MGDRAGTGVDARPDATESNGAVWPTLGQAVWALREGRDFADVMRLVIDLGGDTDTVAAVAGGLAGAVFGMGGIPSRWASAVHGRVPGTRRAGLAARPTCSSWPRRWTAAWSRTTTPA